MNLASVKLWFAGAWRSRTMWAATALGCFGVAQTQLDYLRALVKPEFYGHVTIGIAIVVGVLRMITRTSIIAKTPGAATQNPPEGA